MFSQASGNSRKVAGTASPRADVSWAEVPTQALLGSEQHPLFRDPGFGKESSDEMRRGNPGACPGPTRADHPSRPKAEVLPHSALLDLEQLCSEFLATLLLQNSLNVSSLL